jgi:5-methylcytosine-specific restriction endonuclease McrA
MLHKSRIAKRLTLEMAYKHPEQGYVIAWPFRIPLSRYAEFSHRMPAFIRRNRRVRDDYCCPICTPIRRGRFGERVSMRGCHFRPRPLPVTLMRLSWLPNNGPEFIEFS